MAVEWLKIREPAEAISLDKVIRLATHGGVRPGAGRPKSGEPARVAQQGVNNQPAIGRLKYGTNSRAHTIARLDRDRPDLAERVRNKQISANRAAIQAGFRKPNITIPLDPIAAARLLHRHFKGKAWDALLRCLQEIEEPCNQATQAPT